MSSSPSSSGCHAGAPHSFAQTPNVVIQWNQILQTLLGEPGTQNRSLPMMHIAMFDAINSIQQVYMPYHVRGRPSHSGSALWPPGGRRTRCADGSLPCAADDVRQCAESATGWYPARIRATGRGSWSPGRGRGPRMAEERRLAGDDRLDPRTCCPRSRVCGSRRRPQTA